MSDNSKNSNRRRDSRGKFWSRVLCLILAGVMIIGLATYAIFIIVDSIRANAAKQQPSTGTTAVTTTATPDTTTAETPDSTD